MPPPPPPNAPPPAYQGPAYQEAPVYQAPLYPQAPSPYQASQPGYAYPGQTPQPINPTAAAFGISGALFNQFTGYALSSIITGALSVGVPLAFNRYYFILPILGIISGLRAVQRGKLIGGLVGIGLNGVGVLFTLIGMGVLGG